MSPTMSVPSELTAAPQLDTPPATTDAQAPRSLIEIRSAIIKVMSFARLKGSILAEQIHPSIDANYMGAIGAIVPTLSKGGS